MELINLFHCLRRKGYFKLALSKTKIQAIIMRENNTNTQIVTQHVVDSNERSDFPDQDGKAVVASSLRLQYNMRDYEAMKLMVNIMVNVLTLLHRDCKVCITNSIEL